MVIDPITSLAFTMQANPGTLALLLGSGVSTGAGIPTGWAIVLDLMNKLAQVEGEEVAQEDLENWYTDRFDAPPEYSTLLDGLARTQAERQGLIRGYIEPTEEEREQGLKVPTEGHRAIARLVSEGFVRVIVTTNFDRLLELSLQDEGVDYDVISTVDAIRGARPLVHSPCLIVKVHGDYRDARIRNTVGELADYEEEMNALLDRVLTDHGLIVCGWSATWDPALRGALVRNATRFSSYWATRGELTTEADDLVRHRQAKVVDIDSADQFFRELSDRLTALVQLDRPHPLTVAAAVGEMKRYLPDPTRSIRLHDLVMNEANRVNAALSHEHFPVEVPNDEFADDEMVRGVIENRVGRYQSIVEQMTHLLSVGVAWSKTPDQTGLWGQALERVANHAENQFAGRNALLALRRYPALLCFYAAGIASIVRLKFDVLRVLALDQRYRELDKFPPMIASLQPWRAFDPPELVTVLQHGGPRGTPISSHLHATLRDQLREVVPADEAYTDAFDLFEYVADLVMADAVEHEETYIPPPYIGAYAVRHQYQPQQGPVGLVGTEIGEPGELVKGLLDAGFFGQDIDRLQAAVDSVILTTERVRFDRL